MKKKVTLVKLGGSIITNKEVPMMVREDTLKRLVREIAKAKKETNELFVIGHGQGSFAHSPAMRYRTKEGFVSKDSVMGMAITQDSAAQLNRIVVKAFLSAQIPAASFLFSNSMVTNEDNAEHWCGDVLYQYLEKGILPVTGGDVIVDTKQGCTIWSTEKVLGYIATSLPVNKYDISRIIHVTEVDGVLDGEESVIPEINNKNKEDIKQHMTETKGFDVTGGMWHKIEESIDLTKEGIDSYIISGMKKNNLYNCLLNKEFVGTTIKK